jgi:hypothetical protein
MSQTDTILSFWNSKSAEKFRVQLAQRHGLPTNGWRKQSILEFQDDRELLLEAHHPLRALISNERKLYPEAEFTLEWCDPTRKGFGSFPPWCIVWMQKFPFAGVEVNPVMLLSDEKAISFDVEAA